MRPSIFLPERGTFPTLGDALGTARARRKFYQQGCKTRSPLMRCLRKHARLGGVIVLCAGLLSGSLPAAAASGKARAIAQSTPPAIPHDQSVPPLRLSDSERT